MSHNGRSLAVSLASFLIGSLVAAASALAATGEVTRSGSTWTGRVDGSTVYTGSSMFDAVNTTMANMSSGTVNIRNSGDSGPGNGSVYAINMRSNITLDFHNNSIDCIGDQLIVPIRGVRANNIGIRNLNVTGDPRYGIWLSSCSDITIDDIDMDVYWTFVGIRVDDDRNVNPSGLDIGRVNVTGTGSHAVETYGIDDVDIETVTATDVGGCGLLLNDSNNCTVGSVYGLRCDSDGGYAAFRVANGNGTTTADYVWARECGRGFFSVSGSSNCTVNFLDAAECNSHGIAIQDSSNTRVLAGSSVNNSPNIAIWGSGSGNSTNVSTASVTGIRSIRNVQSNRALDVYNFNNTNGGNIAIYDFWGGDAQRFNVAYLGDGLYSVRSVLSGNRSLDIDGWGGNGANVMLWDYLGGTNQRYSIDAVGTGQYRLSPLYNPDLCIDAFGTANGSNVGVWSYWGGANQKWYFVTP